LHNKKKLVLYRQQSKFNETGPGPMVMPLFGSSGPGWCCGFSAGSLRSRAMFVVLTRFHGLRWVTIRASPGRCRFSGTGRIPQLLAALPDASGHTVRVNNHVHCFLNVVKSVICFYIAPCAYQHRIS
jgi:hypothetical protein